MNHVPAADHHLIGENLIELNQPIFLASLRALREQQLLLGLLLKMACPRGLSLLLHEPGEAEHSQLPHHLPQLFG